jgi:GT2 family glycosyltransferase
MAMTTEVWRGSSGDLAALLAVQHALAQTDDAPRRVRRAQLLAAGGCDGAALADAMAAADDDPSDPQALLALARLSPGGGHDPACAVVASPFATSGQRQAALPFLGPACLPLALACDLPATVRLTLLQRATDSCTLDGLAPADFPKGLGRAGDLVATDFFLCRDETSPRMVAVTLGPHLQHVEVAPLSTRSPVACDAAAAPLWIILPVKDGGPVLAACLQTVKAEVAALPGCRVVVVDDGSVQPETAAVLQGWRGNAGVTVMATPRPLGFTGAVNLGLAAVGQGPVLLLNSDTWLPPGTLRRLLGHLSDPTIGTVTPLTNNGGSFSVPAPRTAHRMPDAATCTALAAEAWQRNRGVAVDVLTGNGFCMLISGACLAVTGALSTHYDSGYFEEVDFCLRARARGFRHVAAVDCFVGHHGAVSYGAARRRLVAANRRRIAARHPAYPGDYLRFALADPIAPFRARLSTAARLVPADLAETSAPVPNLTVLLPGPVLPVAGPAAAWRAVAGAARAAGLLAEPASSLRAAGLHLCPAHPITAVPLPDGGLRVLAPDGRRVADLTAGPRMAEVARRVAEILHAAQAQAVDGLSI